MMNNSNDVCTHIGPCMPCIAVSQMPQKIASTVRRVASVSVSRAARCDVRATTPSPTVGRMRYTAIRRVGITTATHAVAAAAPYMRVQVMRQAWPQTSCPAEVSVGVAIGPHMGSVVGGHIASPVARAVGTSTCGIAFCVAYRGVCADVAVAARDRVWRNVHYRAATTTCVHACARVKQRIGETTVRDFPTVESPLPRKPALPSATWGFSGGRVAHPRRVRETAS